MAGTMIAAGWFGVIAFFIACIPGAEWANYIGWSFWLIDIALLTIFALTRLNETDTQ